MTTALTKIAAALDLLAADLDAARFSTPTETEPTQTKAASSVDLMEALYRERTGDALPDTVRDKLASVNDPELESVFSRLLKTAAAERPTPLGAPADMPTGTPEPTTGAEATKLAYDAFAEAILNAGED